jgi:hypothetical protein
MPCELITCCPEDPFVYRSVTASDAKGSGTGDVAGPVNPNCPDGYIFGGLACVRVQDPQVCSTGYTWNGSACVPS